MSPISQGSAVYCPWYLHITLRPDTRGCTFALILLINSNNLRPISFPLETASNVRRGQQRGHKLSQIQIRHQKKSDIGFRTPEQDNRVDMVMIIRAQSGLKTGPGLGVAR